MSGTSRFWSRSRREKYFSPLCPSLFTLLLLFQKKRIYYYEFCRHSWLRRRLPKPPAEAPPLNRPSAVLRHHQLHAVQQQQNASNGDSSGTGGRTNSGTGGTNGIYGSHNQQQLNNTNSKTVPATNELNRHQKLPHIGGVHLNSTHD